VLGGPSRGEHLFSFSEKVKFHDFSEIFELKNDGSVKSDKISEEFRNEVGHKSIYQKSYEKENAFLGLFHVLLELAESFDVCLISGIRYDMCHVS
jgi:hypothetical protein